MRLTEETYITVTEPLVLEVENAPSPARALACFLDLPYPLLLESAAPNPETGRYSYLMADPFARLEWKDGETVRPAGEFTGDLADGQPFELLRRMLERYTAESVIGLPPFQGGAAGYVGYDVNRALERLPGPAVDDLALPDLLLGFYDWTLAWDHATDRCWLISTGFPASDGQRAERAAARAAMVREQLKLDHASAAPLQVSRTQGADLPLHPVPGLEGVHSTFERDAYIRTVARAREYVLAGDIFQANISQRLQAPTELTPFALYERLRERNPAPYAGYLDWGRAALVGASPELFLRVQGRSVETRPIKGTARRSPDPDLDRRSAERLAASEKDRAENVMIVDLLRNDLSIVCTDESVLVPRLCNLESHGAVHHLVSTVTGELRPGRTAVDLLEAAFPGGSITGAPKIRAMEIIAELEPTARGPYTGAMGFIGFDGWMEMNIIIRTFVVKDGTAYLQVGGGIVADSDPEREHAETLDKARGLVAAFRGDGGEA